MNDTEIYLSRVKADLPKILMRSFLICFTGSAVAAVISFLLFRVIPCGNYLIVCDISDGSFLSNVKNAVDYVFPCAVQMIILYLSAYSTLSGAVSMIVTAWRGICLGSSLSIILSGSVGGIGNMWRVSAWLYFSITVVIAIFAAVSLMYSGALTFTSGCGEKKYFRSLSAEFTKCFLLFSGVVFILGCASALFI